MPISQIVTNSIANDAVVTVDIANGAVTSAKMAAGAARANFGAGAVLQVVNVTYNTVVTSTSTSYADTGLTASITPTSASSKILIIIAQPINVFASTSKAECAIKLLRNSTDLNAQTSNRNANAVEASGATFVQTGQYYSTSYLDSPSTTSSVTYKTQGALQATTGSAMIVWQRDGAMSQITLMEIAA
jgi:hypothetical protein